MASYPSCRNKLTLDITIEQEAKALATLEDENDNRVSKKWKNDKGSLAAFCGVKTMKK